MSQYRDPFAGLVSQIAMKRGIVRDRETRVSPVLVALLPEAIGARIEAHRATALDESASGLEALMRVDAALDALATVYEEALLHEDPARRLAFEVADPPRPDIPPPWLIEEDGQLRFRRALGEALAKALDDDDVTLLRWGDFAYVARFREGGAPHVLHVLPSYDTHSVEVVSFVGTLRAAMPERTPELDVRVQRAHHTVGKALGLAHEIDTGDPAFDAAFWIRGERRALPFLPENLRSLLVSLARDRAPRLRLQRGEVSFEWSGAPESGLGLGAALGVVKRLLTLAESG
ncbi:MAG: hypothetical protein JST00_25145 [Deltaproteobacteria bacterium]|nr:hypothetical protein [Deltaproteobacteria bacterium]